MSSTSQNVRVVVKVNKVLDFKEINFLFGQDKKIKQKLGTIWLMFVIEVDHIIKQSFAIEIFHKRRHQRMVQGFMLVLT
jgi:hypothetical protein